MTDNIYLDKQKEDKKEKAELTAMAGKIQDPIISTEQIVAVLSRTPKQYLYDRPAKGGGKWTYVSGGYVKKTLNRVFGWRWSFQIVDKFREDGEVIVQGRLIILNDEGVPCITKEDFGKKEIMCKKNSTTPLSIGNDYKSASTDALKRCAYQLGIASDVYAPKEFNELKGNPSEMINEKKSNRQRQCEVCGEWFDTDKPFMKECRDCYKLSREEKKSKVDEIKKEAEAEEKKLGGQPFTNKK